MVSNGFGGVGTQGGGATNGYQYLPIPTNGYCTFCGGLPLRPGTCLRLASARQAGRGPGALRASQNILWFGKVREGSIGGGKVRKVSDGLSRKAKSAKNAFPERG